MGEVPQRTKRFANRVRSGCATCKIRRVKCDEEKPSCQRCVSTGRKCDGYPVPVPISHKPSHALTPRAQNSAAERQAFYMFRTKICYHLSSAFDADFWTRELVRNAESYGTIRHAVVALASAYNAFVLNGKSGPTQAQKRFVLHQYDRSIATLRRCLSLAPFRTRDQNVVVLIIGILFNCICTLQGLRTEACLHLRGGLALLQEWQLGNTQKSADGDITPSSISLVVSVYTRLDNQARVILKADDCAGRKPWQTHKVCPNAVDTGFSSDITRAFSRLDVLYNQYLQSFREIYPFSDQLEIRKALSHYHDLASRWDSEFARVLSSIHSGDLAFLTATELHRQLLQANLEEQGLGLDEGSTVNLQRSCNLMLHTAKRLIKLSGLEKGRIVFNPAGNLIETLYFVATHSSCADGRVQALELLRNHPLIEGLWNSAAAAQQAVERSRMR